MIGGYAVSIHGYPRYTKDLDICIELSGENAAKMINVLKDFGLSSLGLTKEDFTREKFVTQLGYEPLRIDILNDIDGVSFKEAWDNRKEVTYESVKINFVGYNELILLKTLAGRKQDIADIEKLTERNKNK
ncbi:MAG: hypothetical protein JWP69_600 [Flaviaesturariibacter sp.]|nr:hypothetical protein [Flaviaesturariibacter sp.]